MDSKDRIETKELRRVIRSARAHGYLVPVFAELERLIGCAEAPLEPTGAEWPFVRARQDGKLDALVKFESWLRVVSNPSPDEAENTED